MMMLKSEIEEIATIVHQAHQPAMKRPVIQEAEADAGANDDDDFAKFMAQ